MLNEAQTQECLAQLPFSQPGSQAYTLFIKLSHTLAMANFRSFGFGLLSISAAEDYD